MRAVWVNEDGGVTFRLGSAVRGAAGREFIKVADAGTTDFRGAAAALGRCLCRGAARARLRHN
jgi:hypothetical protein